MRVERLMLDGDLEGGQLDFGEPLTVLFGANSSGKTRLLETIASIVAGDPTLVDRRSVPGGLNVLRKACVVLLPNIFSTDECELVASAFDVNEATSTTPNDHDAPRKAADAIAGTGPEDHRHIFALGVIHAARIALSYDHAKLTIHESDLPPTVLDSARVLDTTRFEAPDSLVRVAKDIVTTGCAWIRYPHAALTRLTSRLPPVVMLPLEPPAPLGQLAEELVLAAYDLIVQEVDANPFDYDALVHRASHIQSLEIHPSGDISDDDWIDVDMQYPGRDPWLIPRTRDEGGEDLTYIVNPLIKDLARLLGSQLSRSAPCIFGNNHRLDLIVTDPRSWSAGQPRTEVVIRSDDGQITSVDSLGAGARRWALAALLLVKASLPPDLWLSLPHDSDLPSPSNHHGIPNNTMYRGSLELDGSAQPQWTHAGQAPLARYLADLVTGMNHGQTRAILLVDEPEAHLHPAALAEVSRWLLSTARGTTATVVATHSVRVLDLDSETVSRVLVQRCSPPLIPIGPVWADDLADHAAQLGITPGELLLLRRGLVFVEGPHDKIILRRWIGEELRAAGVHILPAHGVDNMPGLLESEVIAALGLPLGIVTDHCRSAPEGNLSKEERITQRIIREAEAAGHTITPFGLAEPDILCYIPDSVMQMKYSTFPGWARVKEEWTSSPTREPMKNLLWRQYGVKTDRSSIRVLANTTSRGGLVPPDIKRLASEITAWAHRVQL